MQLIKEIKGSNGTLKLFQERIVLNLKGLGMFRGETTIYFNQISGISVRSAGIIDGCMRITDSSGRFYNFFFNRKLNESIKQLKNQIEIMKNKPSAPSIQSTQGEINFSAADEIRKFKQLLDEGIITQEDFDKKKNELIG